MSKLSLFDNIRNYIRGKSAEKLKAWEGSKEYLPDAVNSRFDELEKSISSLEPRMNVSELDVVPILKSGKFKNQFQTHTSGGSLDFDERMEHTARHFGTPNNERALKNSEKYGWLKDNYGQLDHNWNNRYGIYTMDFRPSVKERMTAHIGDSLGSRSGSFIPGDRSTYGAILEDVPDTQNVQSFYMENLKDGLPLADRGAYLEAQFHGPLTTGDIKSIKVHRDRVDPYVKKWSTNNYVPLYDENGCYNACFDVAGNRIME